MKSLMTVAALLAVAWSPARGSPPAEAYAHGAELYQAALERQQQGLYSERAAPPAHAAPPAVLSSVSERDAHGYQFAYETENGIKAQEVGRTGGHEYGHEHRQEHGQEHGHEHEHEHGKGTQAHGSYSYTGDDGHVYSVTYTADEHGFRAQGAHLPTAPPLPQAVADSLQRNAHDEAAGIFDDGQYAEASHDGEQASRHAEHQGSEQRPQAETFHYETAAYQQDEFQPSGFHQAARHQSYQPSDHQSYQQSEHQSYQQNDHQSYQPSGYHTMNIPVEGYRKH